MLEKRTGQPPERHEPEVEALTGFLNQLFIALAISITRYAARVRRDKGTISRYLNGHRIAPRPFIDELLKELADLTGNPVTDDVRAQAYELRLQALQVRNPARYELEQLRDLLGAAERELKLADVRERALLQALKGAEDQTREAEQRYRQLESDWALAHYASSSAELDVYVQTDGAHGLGDEIRGLKAELEALRIELSRAQALKHDAEEKCLRLEARLLAAEATLQTERTYTRKSASAELERAQAEAQPDPQVLQRAIADLNAASSLAGTLQATVEGAVHVLEFDVAVVHLVRPADGDLVVAAIWELEDSGENGPAVLLGQVGARESWDRMLNVSDHWGTLRFLPHDRAGAIDTDVPTWTGDGPLPVFTNDWHPHDFLFAPMYSASGDLLGVLSVDQPHSGKHPGTHTRTALESFALQSSIAIGNARLRAEMQRALARLEKEQQSLRASEEGFRQAFEYAPSGMAITELHGGGNGQLTRVNDALCRLLGRPRALLRQQSFADLVHPEDLALLQRTSAEAGMAEVRLSRRDGSYQQVRLRHSIVRDAAKGPAFLMTVVEDLHHYSQR
ncbi:PAS domain S-box protein [Kitasatospora sp. NBC_00315]|uniref:PAS domain S-box protein n=1 Tax=Kitasatospora sp. NBC_00315 TaxID=2975963 RepID=UPI003254B39C